MKAVATLSRLFAAICFVGAGASPAAAQSPDAGPNWILVEEKAVAYDLAGSLVKTATETKLIDTRATATATEERNRALRRGVKESNAAGAKSSAADRDVAGPKIRSVRDEGRYRNSYDNWKVDTVKTTTVVTPYRLYDVADWEERTKTTWNKTFQDTVTYTWADAINGKPIEVSRKADPTIVKEYAFTEWAPKQIKTFTAEGTDVATSSVVVRTEKKEQRVGQIAAAAGEAGAADEASLGNISFSGDSGKGAAGARSASAGSTQKYSGSGRVKAQGGKSSGPGNLSALLDAAAAEPDLFGSKGVKAWKLRARGKALVLYPYGPSGQIGSGIALASYGDGSLGGSVPGMGSAILSGYDLSAGSVTLSGQFRNELLAENSRELKTR